MTLKSEFIQKTTEARRWQGLLKTPKSDCSSNRRGGRGSKDREVCLNASWDLESISQFLYCTLLLGECVTLSLCVFVSASFSVSVCLCLSLSLSPHHTHTLHLPILSETTPLHPHPHLATQNRPIALFLSGSVLSVQGTSKFPSIFSGRQAEGGGKNMTKAPTSFRDGQGSHRTWLLRGSGLLLLPQTESLREVSRRRMGVDQPDKQASEQPQPAGPVSQHREDMRETARGSPQSEGKTQANANYQLHLRGKEETDQ